MDELVTRYHRNKNSWWGTGVIVVDELGRFLVGLRSDTKTWGSPGGKVDIGETPLQAIMREAKEEAGITLQNLELIGTSVTGYKNKMWVWLNFFCRNFKGEIVHHVDNVAWGEFGQFFIREQLSHFRVKITRSDLFKGLS